MKKSLGQHFLLNPTTVDKILRLANVQKTDSVLEIGPGLGIMTEMLLERCERVVAVEKDWELVEKLRKKFSNRENLTLIGDDFLKIPLSPPLLKGEGWRVIANLPYNVATEIIFKLLDRRHFIDSMYLMVQREVANRIVASPGSKDYGPLSISSQLFSENKIVIKLPPGAFTPPPKVDSAVVEFKVSEKCRFPIQDILKFKKIVRVAFQQRRKMIRNSLASFADSLEDIFKEAGISGDQRPEELSIEHFAHLANLM